MTTLDVPCDGRATFHRLGVQGLRDALLAEHERTQAPVIGPLSFCVDAISTYLRPIAYLTRRIGT
jgi:hypothetical protein